MEKNDKNSNIERLLQAVESPEKLTEKELREIMNNDDTAGLYSLLSDIEAVRAIDNSPVPNVEAEWRLFMRSRRKMALRQHLNSVRKYFNWQLYISAAAVILFAIFISVPLMMEKQNDASIAESTEEHTDYPIQCRQESGRNYIMLNEPMEFYNYRTGFRPTTIGELNICAHGIKIVSDYSEAMKRVIGNFGFVVNSSPMGTDVGMFAPARFAPLNYRQNSIYLWTLSDSNYLDY